METPDRPIYHLALVDSHNILQDEQVGEDPSLCSSSAKSSSMSMDSISSGVLCAPAVAAAEAAKAKEGQSASRAEAAVVSAAIDSADVDAAADSARAIPEGSNKPSASKAEEDAEDASVALAIQLLQEEAVASYAAAVDMFRGVGERDIAEIDDEMTSEDMAVMQALLEEDENEPNAIFMAEDESLDYDGMLELGSAIGDVRQERWRLRSKAVINSLPRVKYYTGRIAIDDSKCLVCQCDYEEGDELRILPCKHAFHAECVDGWLEQSEECPTCRRSVSE